MPHHGLCLGLRGFSSGGRRGACRWRPCGGLCLFPPIRTTSNRRVRTIVRVVTCTHQSPRAHSDSRSKLPCKIRHVIIHHEQGLCLRFARVGVSFGLARNNESSVQPDTPYGWEHISLSQKLVDALMKQKHLQNRPYSHRPPATSCHPSSRPQLFHIRSKTLNFSHRPKLGSSKSRTSSRNPSRRRERKGNEARA